MRGDFLDGVGDLGGIISQLDFFLAECGARHYLRFGEKIGGVADSCIS